MTGPIIHEATVHTTERQITIDPITRLEGHGKIEIFLNDEGNVENAYLQIPELRGFERFCLGRHVSELPILTNRLCGVCPAAHHIASARTLDAVFDTEPTETAHKVRELFYMGQQLHSHIAHFYALAAPDFVLGPAAPKEKRNILGVVEAVGLEIGGEVIKHRSYGQKIQEMIGGRATHPVFGIPGGVSKRIKEDERQEMEKMAKSSVEFGKFGVQLFKDLVLKNQEYLDIVKSQDLYYNETYYMGLVDANRKVAYYLGDVRVVDPLGNEYVTFKPHEYLDHIREKTVEWSYMKLPYLKNIGWKGFVDGPSSGIYRVGPLGRLNASNGYSTPLAQEEYKVLKETFKSLGVTGPIHHTLAFHWARVIEILNVSERMLELASDETITSSDIRAPVGEPGEGVGIVEAPRGTLIHHYAADKNGLTTKLNMIVASTNNYAASNMSVAKVAKGLIHNGEISNGLLNMVEMAFRCYDPCHSCGTHTLSGQYPTVLTVYDHNRNTVMSTKNF